MTDIPEVFSLGETLTWDIEMRSGIKTKIGVVTQIVAPGTLPSRKVFPWIYPGKGVGLERPVPSYAVTVGAREYWPTEVLRRASKTAVTASLFPSIDEPRSDNAITSFHETHRFLSNMAPAEVKYGPYLFPAVEQAYQFAKLPKEKISEYWIRKFQTANPWQAKHLGRSIDKRPDWDAIKERVMRYLLDQKFTLPEYRQLLLATGSTSLIEGNVWHDNVWGDCRCRVTPKIECKYGQKPECDLPGQNLLGLMLMEIRASAAQTAAAA
jgi:hypothetical protein